MKKILVACGNGIATSTVVATKIKEFLYNQGKTDIVINQCKLMEVPGKVEGYDLLVTTGQFEGQTKGVPIVKGMPLLIGIGDLELLETISSILSKEEER